MELLSGLGLEMDQTGTETDHSEYLGRFRPEIIKNGSETYHLQHLGSLGPEMLQNYTQNNQVWPLNDTLRWANFLKASKLEQKSS